MRPYFNDVVVPTTWGPLVTAPSANSGTTTAPDDVNVVSVGNPPLKFLGNLTASNANTAIVEIRGKRFPAVKSNLDGSKFEFLPIGIMTDLSEIEVQGSGGTQVLKVQGWVE